MVTSVLFVNSRAGRPDAWRQEQVRADVQARPGPEAADDATATDRSADDQRLPPPARGRRHSHLRLAAGGSRRLTVPPLAHQGGDPNTTRVVRDVVARFVTESQRRGFGSGERPHRRSISCRQPATRPSHRRQRFGQLQRASGHSNHWKPRCGGDRHETVGNIQPHDAFPPFPLTEILPFRRCVTERR